MIINRFKSLNKIICKNNQIFEIKLLLVKKSFISNTFRLRKLFQSIKYGNFFEEYNFDKENRK